MFKSEKKYAVIKGGLVVIGVVLGFCAGVMAGFMVGFSPPVISFFTDLIFNGRSGGFIGDRLNGVVFTLPVFSLVGAVIGGWWGHRTAARSWKPSSK